MDLVDVLYIPGYYEETDFMMQDVYNRYSEPWRFYHTTNHLDSMVDFLLENEYALENSTRVLWAAMYHDAVYIPSAPSGVNEELSAKLAEVGLLDWPNYHWVRDAIKRTRDHQYDPEENDMDLAWFLDADLHKLAAPWDEFDLNNKNIELEYLTFYTQKQFLNGRKHFLSNFIARDRIFATDYAYETFEKKARENLAQALAQLS